MAHDVADGIVGHEDFACDSFSAVDGGQEFLVNDAEQ